MQVSSLNTELVPPAECFECKTIGGDYEDNDNKLYLSVSKNHRNRQLSDASAYSDESTTRTSICASSTTSSSSSGGGVSGETVAMNINRMRGFPTDAKMSEQVYELPRRVRGKYFAPRDSGFEPAATEGHVLKIFVQREGEQPNNGGGNMLNGCVVHTMNDNRGRPYASGATLAEVYRPLGRPVMFLRDANERPVAFCRQEHSMMGVRTYGIYGTGPLVDGKPGKTVKEKGKTYYPWFRLEETRRDKLRNDDVAVMPGQFQGSIPFRRVTVWNGRAFEPMWRVYPGRMTRKRTKGFQDAADDEDYENEYIPNTNEILICNEEGTEKFATLLKYLTVGWQVTVAPGIDPAVILSITAVMDESLRDNVK